MGGTSSRWRDLRHSSGVRLRVTRLRSSHPLAKSHTLSVRSFDAETASRPSPLNATLKTRPEWPARVRSSRPLPTFHTFSVSSSDAETASRPSEVTATASTELEWPLPASNALGTSVSPCAAHPRFGNNCPVSRSHRIHRVQGKQNAALRVLFQAEGGDRHQFAPPQRASPCPFRRSGP